MPRLVWPPYLLAKLDGEGEVEGCTIVARDREEREVCARCLHRLWGRGRSRHQGCRVGEGEVREKKRVRKREDQWVLG
jgi:hypothetical protein